MTEWNCWKEWLKNKNGFPNLPSDSSSLTEATGTSVLAALIASTSSTVLSNTGVTFADLTACATIWQER